MFKLEEKLISILKCGLPLNKEIKDNFCNDS